MAGSAIAVSGAVVGYPQEPKKAADISGDTPADIAQAIRDAIGDMKSQWFEDEVFIRDKIRSLSDLMSGYTPTDPEGPPRSANPHPSSGAGNHTYDVKTTYEFILPRPTLADATPGNAQDDSQFGQPEK